MKLVAPFVLTLALYGAYNEPSAFGAGDLNSPSPYGLTKSEQSILENKKKIEEYEKKLNEYESATKKGLYNLESKLKKLDSQIDGITSIVESQSDNKVKNIKQTSQYAESIIQVKGEVSEVKQELISVQKIHQDDIENMKTVLKELSSLIDSINNSYVSIEQFNKFQETLEQKLTAISQIEPKKKEINKTKKSNPALSKEGQQLYKSKKYSDAKGIFEELIANNYKPAQSNFYLGMISYNLKEYKLSLAYFKKSISIYSKASYAPELLYYTAKSYEELGDTKNAKKSYTFLIKSYPNSKFAKIAASK